MEKAPVKVVLRLRLPVDFGRMAVNEADRTEAILHSTAAQRVAPVARQLVYVRAARLANKRSSQLLTWTLLS